jgi:hypothetical protein
MPPLRIAFVGQSTFFAACVPTLDDDENVTTFIEFREGFDPARNSMNVVTFWSSSSVGTHAAKKVDWPTKAIRRGGMGRHPTKGTGDFTLRGRVSSHCGDGSVHIAGTGQFTLRGRVCF